MKESDFTALRHFDKEELRVLNALSSFLRRR